MADWTKPFEAAYTWYRVPRSTYVGDYDVGYESEAVTNITDGTITVNDNTETFESAEVNCIGELNVGTDLLRCHMVATWDDGTTEDVVLGTFSVSVPSRDVHGSYEECRARLDGRLMQLASDYFDSPYVIPKGNNIRYYFGQVIRGAGLTYNDTPNTVSAPSAEQTIVWGLGSNTDALGGSKLAFCNHIMSLCDARAIKTDPYGRVMVQKPIDYDGAPVWTFTEGINATFLGDATDERDTTDVCNKVVVVYESADATIIGVATDTDADSPWSIANLGYTKCAEPYHYDLTDTTTQATANAKAQELLDSSRSVVRRVTIKHVWCGVRVGDIVEFSYPSAGISGKFAVRTQSIEIGSAGCLVTSELRRFERA